MRWLASIALITVARHSATTKIAEEQFSVWKKEERTYQLGKGAWKVTQKEEGGAKNSWKPSIVSPWPDKAQAWRRMDVSLAREGKKRQLKNQLGLENVMLNRRRHEEPQEARLASLVLCLVWQASPFTRGGWPSRLDLVQPLLLAGCAYVEGDGYETIASLWSYP